MVALGSRLTNRDPRGVASDGHDRVSAQLFMRRSTNFINQVKLDSEYSSTFEVSRMFKGKP